jgi:hypothetical protein
MGYGDPSKLDQAVNVIQKTIQSLNQKISVGLVTFDTTAEVLSEPKTFNNTIVRASLERIVTRGVTCLASGLTEAINLINKSGLQSEILLLTDGRANLSLNRMGGFEGSIALEEELLKITDNLLEKKPVIHTVAVGEDAFTQTLIELSRKTKGRSWLAEDFQDFNAEPPISRPLKVINLKVHSAPVELPSAKPTWTKESQMMHVAVVSQRLYKTYQFTHRAFLVNQNKNREARTALLSINSEVLAGYRERRAKTADAVRRKEAILLDRSYRDFLALGENDTVRLVIY